LLRQTGNGCLSILLLLLVTTGSQAGTYFESAQQYLNAGQETEARRALELELSYRPDNLEARYDLAVLLERIGHEDSATELYRENIRRGHHLPSVVNLSAWLKTHGQIEQAYDLLQQATQDFHDEAVPWYLLADMVEQAGNNKQAYELYQKALKADEKNAYANLRFARFLAATKHPDAAVAQAEKAVSLLPSCAPCLKLAGDIFDQTKNHAGALALWQRSIAIQPDRALRQKILRAQNSGGKTRP